MALNRFAMAFNPLALTHSWNLALVSSGFACFKRLFCPILFALSVLVATCAKAQEQYGLGWQIGSQVEHEENLFLKPANQANSDTILGSIAAVDYRKRYSLQTFQIKAKVTDVRYDRFDYLDYLGKDLDAAWLWALTPELTGTLSSSRQEGLNSFVDYDGSKRNLRKERKDALDVRWRVSGGWHLAAGANQSAVRNTLGGERFAEGDYTANNAEYGFMYSFPSQSQITLVQMLQSGEYRSRTLSNLSQFDSGFDQTSPELRVDWRLSGKSALNIKLGHLNREHDHFPLRDYSGTYGSADYLWYNGGKLKIKLNARQNYNSFQSSPQRDLIDALAGRDYYNASFYRSQVLSIAPTWQLLDKVSISGKLQQEERDYQGGLLTGAQLRTRQDTLRQGTLSLDWVPRDVVALSLHVSRQERDSNMPTADFTDESIGMSAVLSF